MVPTLQLPRSAVLAAWLGAGGPPTRLLAAVQGDDEPHTVRDGDRTSPLADYLAALGGELDAACVLPVPGDPMTLGPQVAAAAIESGEAAVIRAAEGCRSLVPVVRRFGSDLEPGHHVQWVATPVPDWRRSVISQVGSPGEADRALQADLRSATAALQSLDVSHWWPEAAAQVDAVRDAQLPPEQLPARLAPARLRMLTMAARLRAIIALAVADPMVPASVFLADQRAAALREIDRAARRAIAAATTFVADALTD